MSGDAAGLRAVRRRARFRCRHPGRVVLREIAARDLEAVQRVHAHRFAHLVITFTEAAQARNRQPRRPVDSAVVGRRAPSLWFLVGWPYNREKVTLARLNEKSGTVATQSTVSLN